MRPPPRVVLAQGGLLKRRGVASRKLLERVQQRLQVRNFAHANLVVVHALEELFRGRREQGEEDLGLVAELLEGDARLVNGGRVLSRGLSQCLPRRERRRCRWLETRTL